MRFLIFIMFFVTARIAALSQSDGGFSFGSISTADLRLKSYSKDTSAFAVVLDEFGDTRMNSAENNPIVLDYHVRIKILKPTGTNLANYLILVLPHEQIRELQASTFNLEGDKITEIKLEKQNIFTEHLDKFVDVKKLAFPNVRVGSIIELRYVLASPYKYNWRKWEFQTTFPKMHSEFWARIPATYVYNITLRGTQQLAKNESSVLPACYTPGGHETDCAFFKYAMKDIPAFHEEEFMTSKRNFISAITFELAEFKNYDRSRVKYADEWSDIDKRLQQEEDFGGQVKLAKKIWDDSCAALTTNVSDLVMKAKLVYSKIKSRYQWNGIYGHYAQLGAKEAFQKMKGNVADINLTLVGALQAIGLQAEPVLLSTRSNGIPPMTHPVLSDFNYVIVRVTIGADQFWLDATDPLHPFGFVPERCLNGKVRVMSKVSEWVDLKPKDKDKKISQLLLKPNADGSISGKLKVSHFGYDAHDQRKTFRSFSSVEDYKKNQSKQWPNFETTGFSYQAFDSLEKPFYEEYNLLLLEELNADVLYLSPFLTGHWQKNPFRSSERSYPVDFGAPLEEVTILEFEYPQAYEVDELPKNAALQLPQNGGRYLFNVSNIGNKIQMTANLTLNKTVYNPEEYHSLREFFARLVQNQQIQIVLKKKK